MNTIEARCPACGQVALVAATLVGQQTNCLSCHHIFPVAAPPSVTIAQSLRLVADPAATGPLSEPYRVLAAQGITPGSSLADIQELFADTDEQRTAQERLETIGGRLPVDLMLYPHWTREE